MSNKLILFIYIVFFAYINLHAKDTTSSLCRTSIEYCRVFPHYFLYTNSPKTIHSEDMLKNSGNEFSLNIFKKKWGMHVGYSNLKRNYNVEYPPDLNEIIFIQDYSSKLQSGSIGLDLKLLGTNNVGLYWQLSGLLSMYSYKVDYEYYDTQTGNYSKVGSSVTRDFGKELMIFGNSGFSLEINLYKNKVFSTNKIYYCNEISKNKLKNGTAFLAFCTGINLVLSN